MVFMDLWGWFGILIESGLLLSATVPSTNMLLSQVTGTATGHDLVHFRAQGVGGTERRP